MSALPLPPVEVPADSSVTELAPKFFAALRLMLADMVGKGWRPVLRETTRSNARALYLYGFGREYDDGRGIVTNAPNALKTWHHYGVSADVGDRRYDSGSEPPEFWACVGQCAKARGLTWGGEWAMRDLPHVQWWCEGMHVSPSDHAAELLRTEGVEAVWRELGAI